MSQPNERTHHTAIYQAMRSQETSQKLQDFLRDEYNNKERRMRKEDYGVRRIQNKATKNIRCRTK